MMTAVLKNKKVMLVAGIALLLIVALLFAVQAMGGSGGALAEQLSLGDKYLAALDYDNAILAFSKALKIDPLNVQAYIGRGTAYAKSGDDGDSLSAALADFLKATELDEKNADAWLGLVDVYIRQLDTDKALAAAKTGYEKTGDPRLLEKQKELEEGNARDSSGQVRKMSNYGSNGELVWYHTYSYDLDGRKSSATSYDASGNQTGQVFLTYNEAGKALRSYSYTTLPNTGTISKNENQYDEDGKMVRSDWYDEDGTLSSYDVMEYDSSGQQIKRMQYSAEGELHYYTLYTRDDQGRVIERSDYNENDVLQRRQTMEHKENGDRKTTDFDSDGTVLGYREWNSETQTNTDYNADGTVMSNTKQN